MPTTSAAGETEKKEKKAKPAAGAKAVAAAAAAPLAAAASTSGADATALASYAARLHYQRSRFEEIYKNVVVREMMLKRNAGDFRQLPKLRSVQARGATMFTSFFRRPGCSTHASLCLRDGFWLVAAIACRFRDVACDDLRQAPNATCRLILCTRRFLCCQTDSAPLLTP